MQYFMTSSPFLRRPTASASTPTIRWITSVSCFTPCGARPRWKIWERRAVPSIASITSSRSDASWWMSSRSSGVMKVRSSRFTTSCVTWSASCSRRLIASTEMLREVHAPGLLLVVWAASGIVTLMGALTYGELAAMFPRAGGQYVYLREAISPLFGYLYGWTLFVVIQTGTIAAVAVAFARFTSVLWPGLSPNIFLGTTIRFPDPIGAIQIGLSPQRLFAIVSIVILTAIN